MEMAKVTSKGQITIPISIRKKLNIEEGDKLLFIEKTDGFLIVNPKLFLFDPGAEPSVAVLLSENESTSHASVMQGGSSGNTNKHEAKVSEESVSTSKAFDAAALLNEIRSIGLKI